MSPHAGFLLQDQIVPRLKSAIPNAVPLIAPEDAQEVIQDGTALAVQMVHNAEKNGKQLVKSASNKRRKLQITCGNVAFYVIVKLRNGRRSTGSSVSDVYGVGTQIHGHARLNSLDEVVAENEENGGEIYYLHDVLASNQEDPATKAARKMDWDSFLAGLSKRERSVVLLMIEGKCGAAIARALRTSAYTVKNSKHHLASKIIEFMGPDIIQQIQRRPGWKDSINATREKMAYREERRNL
jgi:ATP/maltotriose-dependent transcriptional regulator MalT